MSTIDDILMRLGPWHYPVLVFCFFRGFPAAYYAMSLSFTAPSLPHWCARPPQLANWSTERWLLEAVPSNQVNGKTMPSRCETYSVEVLVNGTVSILNDSTVRCSSWEYDLGDNINTMTNDFNLVCDRVWLRAASQSFYMAGIMIGNFIFSHMSDWYGRKRALVFMTPLPLMASVVICLSPSFLMLNIGRFVASLGLGGILNTTYTMCASEGTVAPLYRSVVDITNLVFCTAAVSSQPPSAAACKAAAAVEKLKEEAIEEIFA